MSFPENLPKFVVGQDYIEVRRAGRWTWESRVACKRRWEHETAEHEHVVHRAPAHPNHPRAAVFMVGGYPFWWRAWGRERAVAKAERWRAQRAKEAARVAATEVIA